MGKQDFITSGMILELFNGAPYYPIATTTISVTPMAFAIYLIGGLLCFLKLSLSRGQLWPKKFTAMELTMDLNTVYCMLTGSEGENR